MLYSVLIYTPDNSFDHLPAEEQEAYLEHHRKLQADLAARGEFATARLTPVSNAITIKPSTSNNTKPLVVDGPFAETKERFMGLYIFECDSLEDAIEQASKISAPFNHLEIRPVMWSGGLLSDNKS